MAAKTSASSAFNSFFNSFNQQSNTNTAKQMDMNSQPAGGGAGATLNEPSDLHLKMSKKIAQLTKVILRPPNPPHLPINF